MQGDEDEFANGGGGWRCNLFFQPAGILPAIGNFIFRRGSMADGAKRVLILSASAGAGHVRAADALLADFKKHPAVAGGQVEHWDMLKYTTAVFRTIYSKVYLDLVNRAPWFLGMVYKRTDTPWKQGAAQAFEKFNAGPFIKALQEYRPDVVVCTHFTPPNVISWLNTKKKTSPKLMPTIVVTDLDLHAMWLTRSYSRYFVAGGDEGLPGADGDSAGEGDGERDTGGSGVSH